MAKVKRAELLRSLEAVSAGLSAKEIIEQSSSVIFKDGHAMTFNDELAASIKIPLDIEGAVVAEPLMALLRKLPDEEIGVEVAGGDEGKELVVTGDRKQSRIKMAAEITLPVEGVERPDKWAKLPAGFTEAVGVVQQCASRDESQFVLTCVHIHPERVEATDTFQLARYPIVVGLDNPTLVRRASLKSVLGMQATEIAQTENWLHFRNEAGLVISCRRWQDSYVKQEILDDFLKVDGHRITLPKGLDEAIGRAQIFSSEDDGDLISVDLRKDKIRLTGRGPHGQHVERPADVKYDGDEMSFTIAPKLLLDILRLDGKCLVGDGRLLVTTDKWSFVSVTGKPS